MYTMKDWERDGSLNPQIGQIVADDVIDELANRIPPKTYSVSVFQVGEPYGFDFDQGRPTYETFHATKEGWKYVGDRV